MDDGDPRWQDEYTKAAHARDTAHSEIMALQQEIERLKVAGQQNLDDANLQADDFIARIGELQAEAEKVSGTIRAAHVETVEYREAMERYAEENRDLKRSLEQDRTGMAQALVDVRDEVRSRSWLLEGRGPYEWDDDKYKDEAGQAMRKVAGIAGDALRASGTIVAKQLQAGIEPGATPKDGTPIEMGSQRAVSVRVMEDLPNVHMHYLISDAEMDRIGYTIMEVVCHHCQTGTKIFHGGRPPKGDVPENPDPAMLKILNDFKDAHSHDLGGIEEQWRSLCPTGHMILCVEDLRSNPDGE